MDPLLEAKMNDLAERAAEVSKRLAHHGLDSEVHVKRANGEMAIHFTVGAEWFVAVSEILADRLEGER